MRYVICYMYKRFYRGLLCFCGKRRLVRDGRFCRPSRDLRLNNGVEFCGWTMRMKYADEKCCWVLRLNYAVGFLTLIFVSMVLRLILCGYCFTVGFLRSGFCGLFVSISFGDGDYAGGKVVVVICILNGNRHPAHGRTKAMRVTESKHRAPRCRLYKTGKHFSWSHIC